MRILATFANRHHDPEVVELLHAWDDDSVEENYSGFIETLEKAKESWGSDLLRSVTVEIEISDAQILAALNPEAELIQGEITDVLSDDDLYEGDHDDEG